MDFVRDFRDVLTLVNTLAVMVIALVVWLRKPGEEAAAAARRLEQKVDEANARHRERLTEIEARLEHMPTSDELSELEGNVKAIAERTEGLGEAIATIRATLGRIENYLLTSKK